MGIELRLDNVRLAFAQGLWKASAFEEGQQEKFGVDLILGPDSKVLVMGADGKTWEPTTIAAAQGRVCTEAFKGDKAKAKDWFDDLTANQKSVRDGNKKKDKAGEVRDGYAGNQFVSAKNATRPTTLNAQAKPVIEADGVLYGGCYVNARIGLYCNTDPKRKGVFASLGGVQFRKDGDSFGGSRIAAASEFEAATEGNDAAEFA
jgi:hypothetical protein